MSATRQRRRIRVLGYDLGEVGLAGLLLLPSAVVFGVFFYYPFARLLSWGTYKPINRGTAYKYDGWSHYLDVIKSADFRSGMWLSAKYIVYTVPPGLVLGLLLAVLAHRRIKGIKIFQTIFSSTIATSAAVASVIFFVLLSPTIGFFKVHWMESTFAALPALSMVTTWRNLGLAFVICLAGLQAIPDEVNEAAELDGYGPIRKFFRITVPMLWPVLTFLVVVLSVAAFQEFAAVDLVTQGNPAGATELMVYKIFQSQSPTKITVGAVYAVGLFAITMVMAILQFTFLERRNKQ